LALKKSLRQLSSFSVFSLIFSKNCFEFKNASYYSGCSYHSKRNIFKKDFEGKLLAMVLHFSECQLEMIVMHDKTGQFFIVLCVLRSLFARTCSSGFPPAMQSAMFYYSSPSHVPLPTPTPSSHGQPAPTFHTEDLPYFFLFPALVCTDLLTSGLRDFHFIMKFDFSNAPIRPHFLKPKVVQEVSVVILCCVFFVSHTAVECLLIKEYFTQAWWIKINPKTTPFRGT